MKNVKHNRNCVYQTAYHIVWIPKYRRKVLVDDVQEFTIKTLNEIAEDKGFEILALEVCPDHIHLFVSIPPAVAVSQAVKYFKGISARKILIQYPQIRPHKESLWSPSYYVGTAGHVSADTIKHYIEFSQNVNSRR